MSPEAVPDDVPSSEDFSDDDENEYMLGFPEEVPPTALLRHQFPSKVGGRPAWLDPVSLPTPQQLTCSATGQPLNFLLQVYAPLDDEIAREDAFHRGLFLFVTPQGDRISSKGAVRVFRCQLPRRNAYYAYHPPGPGDLLPPALPADLASQSLARDAWRVLEAEAALASAPAAPAPAASDSSPNSQHEAGQPAGEARATGTGVAGEAAADLSGLSLDSTGVRGAAQPSGRRVEARSGSKQPLVLYPERELLVEPEDRETGEEGAAVQRLLAEYESRVEAEGELTEEELPSEVLDQVEETHTLERRHFATFQARTESAPEQVIRYCFQPGARPLWPSPTHHPAPEDIPPCPHCKQPRRFEFQVMPQLLNILDQDELSGSSLDWNTLVVYSCPTSCAAGTAAALRQGSAYVEEFVWVQPAS